MRKFIDIFNFEVIIFSILIEKLHKKYYIISNIYITNYLL